MADIAALDGTILYVNDDSIVTIEGPFPSDPPVRSFVTGPGPAAIPTNEDAAALVARIRPKTPLARLTRPNDTPVWVKGAAVSLVRQPIAGDTPPGERVGAVIFLGTRHQAVEEDVRTARDIINQHGGSI
jgi:hypothetical protein